MPSWNKTWTHSAHCPPASPVPHFTYLNFAKCPFSTTEVRLDVKEFGNSHPGQVPCLEFGPVIHQTKLETQNKKTLD